MRSRGLAALMALLSVAALAGCGSDDEASSGSTSGAAAADANKEPLRVALIPPTTGPLAVFGAEARAAWEFAAKEANANGGVNGHRVELINSNTDGQPATTVRAARRATTQDDASFIGAVMTSPEHGALQQQLASMQALSFNGLGKDDALTGEGCSPNGYRAVQNTSMDIAAITDAIEELPAQRWAIQAVDFSTGRTSAKNFRAAAEAAGKEVVLEQFAPLGTTEFGSYITKLKNANADGLFEVEYGADGVAFVNQGAQFKLFDQYKTVLGFNMVSEPLFETLGDKITGFFNNVGYDVDADSALNQRFVQAYTEETGNAPYYVTADNYLAAQTLFEGVKKAGSVDVEQVKTALNDLTFDSIVGQVTMRGADHQLVRPSYVGRVVKEGGELAFDVISETPGEETTPEPNPDCQL